jgi:hypothetical protein
MRRSARRIINGAGSTWTVKTPQSQPLAWCGMMRSQRRGQEATSTTTPRLSWYSSAPHCASQRLHHLQLPALRMKSHLCVSDWY